MKWIVTEEKKGNVILVSKKDDDKISGMVPKGAYLTIEEGDCKFILRVINTKQNVPYAPSPLIIDLDHISLEPDRKCQNIVEAYRVKTITSRSDGLIDYIKPLSIARLSSQEEVDQAMSMDPNNLGPVVFPASIFSGQIQKLKDSEGNLIKASLPKDMFWHQILIGGKTGMGKTVGIKYLAQHFVEEIGGAVLAINVKEEDLLTMNEDSDTLSPEVREEWNALGEGAHGVANFMVYYPACETPRYSRLVDINRCQPITLLLHRLDSQSLIGLLRGISDAAAQSIPGIFLKWQDKMDEKDITFQNFYRYICSAEDRHFDTLNTRGEPGEIKLHPGTHESIKRVMDSARDYFENPDATFLEVEDILSRGQISVIDIVAAGERGWQFGAILLRDLLHRITEAKKHTDHNIPILIIIDEVHMFYQGAEARQALGDLDTICRTGRSKMNAIIFASQVPTDIPKGLESVINSKIYFRSDTSRISGISIRNEEMECLEPGYAVAQIHGLPQLKFMKFPLSFSGVHKKED